MSCPHLPRFPASWLNQSAGYEMECAYCGAGMRVVPSTPDTSAPPTTPDLDPPQVPPAPQEGRF